MTTPAVSSAAASRAARRRATSAGSSARRPAAARTPAASAALHVATQHEPQVITELRLQPARPVALPRLLPLVRLHHVRRLEMIERHVLPIAGAAEAPRAEHARHGGERRDVLLVVPLVELGLQIGRDV